MPELGKPHTFLELSSESTVGLQRLFGEGERLVEHCCLGGVRESVTLGEQYLA